MRTKAKFHVCRQHKRCCDAVLMTYRPQISHVAAIQETRGQKNVLSKMILFTHNNKNQNMTVPATQKNVHAKAYKFIAFFFEKNCFEEES